MCYSKWLNAVMSLRPRRLSALVLGSRRRRAATAAAVGVLVLIPASPVLAADVGPTRTAASPRREAVILRGVPGATPELTRAVTALRGTVTSNLPIIDGLAAEVPAGSLPLLRQAAGVVSATPDATGRVLPFQTRAAGLDVAGSVDTGSLDQITSIIHARDSWAAGYTGKGVDVALIDTGVAPVTGLTSGNVLNGPDLSFDSIHADVRYKDVYGHGTHLASIIAGRDQAGPPSSYLDRTRFTGVAPDARLVSLKVGASDGSADVSQVIAAIGWVTEHAHANGLNIRVLNLSYGTPAGQDYSLDPLAYAVETAWRKGLVVVVAGGNDGTSFQPLANPAQDPAVIAVGAEDPVGTEESPDDTVPAFSDRGTALRHVDVVAPGVHVLGLRVPNGYVDQAFPSARVGSRFFRGSGTSQAAAVATGATALLLQRNPALTPDEVKVLLAESATAIPLGTVTNTGAGLVDVRAAELLADPVNLLGEAGATLAAQVAALKGLSAPATGTGSLELARGDSHVTARGVTLSGEQDIFAAGWAGASWAQQAAAGTTWTGGTWNGNAWTGTGWTPSGDWAATTWRAKAWFGGAWSSGTWVSRTWVAGGWDSRTWVDQEWGSRTWVDDAWATGGWG
jgi:serine protease AprX